MYHLILLIFIISNILLIYHYLIYPTVVIFLSIIKRKFYSKQEKKEDYTRAKNNHKNKDVSIIICAYNEENVIGKKIKNTLNLLSPDFKKEIIIATDGSTDKTLEIVKKYKNIKYTANKSRKGKAQAINNAIKIASNNIILLTDANCLLNKKSIVYLLDNLNDTHVGGVSGRKIIEEKNISYESTRGDSLFWKIESHIKSCLSYLHTIPTGDGEIFLVRKELIPHFPHNTINDDFEITYNIIKERKLIKYEPRAKSFESASKSLRDDFNVKQRIFCGSVRSIAQHPDLLNPFQSKFNFIYFSHKLLRYATPFLLLANYTSCIFLKNDFLAYLHIQNIILAICILSVFEYLFLKTSKLYYFNYFVTLNLSIIKGLMSYIFKKEIENIWLKAHR